MKKTRFAPSPTGYLHVGGLRTALYCYLFAKKNNGKFILRIEDTDQERLVEGTKENLIKTLKWMGLDYDEGPLENGDEIGESGPYTQSERTELYKEYADKLIKSENAYRCFCSKERLDKMREQQKNAKKPPMYDRKCYYLPKSEQEKLIKEGKPFVIRQKMPHKEIKFKDTVRGTVRFSGKTIDDQILIKSDGFPTYHLANVVDDHLMGITHVIRGEEWLPSTPKHIALYEALGWKPPEFAHLPLLLNEDKTKLSKRQGHVSVEKYIEEGYLKEAILNFVAFLGWHPGGDEQREIFTLKELEDIFELEKVHKAGAVFNLQKLDWFNWKWQKQKFTDKLINLAKQLDENVEITKDNRGQELFTFKNEKTEERFKKTRGQYLYEICEKYLSEEIKQDEEKLYKPLVTVEEKILKAPQETENNINFYFKLPTYEKELLTHERMKVDLEQAKLALKESKKDLEEIENWTEKEIKSKLLTTVEKLEVKNGQVFWPLRAALSGQQFSPGVFEIADTLGKTESITRIERALNKIK